MNRWEVVNSWILGKDYKYGAEIGVKEGKFISYLLSHNKYLKMYAVDPWITQPGENENYTEWDFNKIYEEYRQRVEPFYDRVIEIEEYSVEAAKKILPDNYLDFVFIDAQHDYKSVKNDINAWLPKIKSGGLICGHDYEPNFPGVIQAVNEKFTNYFTGENAVWGVWI